VVPPPESRPPIVGLTGTVAAGKSAALDALAGLGAATVSSDEVVHELLSSERLRDLLVARWGPDVAPDGAIDRERVGAIVFERPDELEWLERTLHPLVAERMAAWRDALPAETRLAVVEVPLLFETGMEDVFDATVSVVAPDHLRSERAAARGTAAVDERAQRQLTQEEKAARADYVVRNDGSLDDLREGLARILPQLLGAARSAG
jgi:dephospho-CoA kinase